MKTLIFIMSIALSACGLYGEDPYRNLPPGDYAFDARGELVGRYIHSQIYDLTQHDGIAVLAYYEGIATDAYPCHIGERVYTICYFDQRYLDSKCKIPLIEHSEFERPMTGSILQTSMMQIFLIKPEDKIGISKYYRLQHNRCNEESQALLVYPSRNFTEVTSDFQKRPIIPPMTFTRF